MHLLFKQKLRSHFSTSSNTAFSSKLIDNPRMKTPTSFLLFLLFALLAFSSFSSAAEAPEPVLDVAGKKLRTGFNYYILPATVRHRYRYGGLTMSSIGNNTCPLGVFQEMSDKNNGIPLNFWPVNPKKGVVRVSTDLNIQFAYPKRCRQSTVWMVDNYVDPAVDSFVSVGGVVGNPFAGTLPNWFKIEKFGNDYKLMYCPSICSYCDVLCKDVGVMYLNGKRRLYLSDYPLRVVFKQA